jgi:WD40 repeat protein
MTAIDPDAILDERLVGFFGARADLVAAEAPSIDEVVAELDRRVHRRGAPRSQASRPSMRFFKGRLAAFAVLIVALLIIAASLLAGAGHHGPSLTVDVPQSSPTVATSPFGSSAPPGHRENGSIEFTRHNATGGDDLWLIDPAGTNERLLVPGGCCGLYSPDGRTLAAAVPGGGLVGAGSTLMGVNVYQPPSSEQSTTIPAECGACEIAVVNSAPDAWSIDGSQVAIDIWSDSDPTQDGMAIAGGPPDRSWVYGHKALLPEESHRDLPIAFSPDGKLLLFVREERTTGPISIGPLLLLDIADRTARQLTPAGMTVSTNGLIQAPASWSPDGTKIVFAAIDSSKTSKASIYITDASAGAQLETIVADEAGATSARFSPDGTWIAYDVLTPGGFHDLHVIHPDGTGDQNLTASFQPGVCCGQWSPDGQALLVTGTSSDNEHSDLFIVSLAGDMQQVTHQPNAYTAFLWGAGPP